jgi:WD40 repeat protein
VSLQPTDDYDAFISYRRVDGADLAEWLRRKLQDYRLPASLAQERKPLQVYLDTAFERANEDFWIQNIEPALRRSRFLIVVITPGFFYPKANGAQSWVEREIELFLSLPQARNIMVVRAAGSPIDLLPRLLQQKYPRIDVVDLSAFQRRAMLPARRAYLNDKILTLIASLYGFSDIHMPVLRQEQKRRRRQAAVRAASVLLILIALGIIVGWQLYRKNQTARQKDQEARDQLTAHYIEQGRQELSQGETLRALPYLSAAYSQGNPNSQLRFMLARAMQTVDALLATLKDYRNHGRMHSVIFSPDSTRVFTDSEDGTVELWDMVRGGDRGSNLGHKTEEQVMARSPDGTFLVTAGSKNGVILWKTGRDDFIEPSDPEWMGVHDGAVNSAVFSQDGRQIVTASSDGTAKTWDADTHKLRFTLPHHSEVLAASFSWDSKLIVTASKDAKARIWEAATGACLRTLADHGQAVVAAAFSRDGKLVVTASDDETGKIWAAATGKLLHTLSHEGPVVAATFNRDGTRVVTASDDRTARIWDAATGKHVHTLSHAGFVIAAAFSEDGTRVVTASGDQAKIWDAVTGDLRFSLEGHSGEVMAVAFSRDGSKVVTASADGTAKVWKATLSPLLNTLDGQTGSVRSVSFSHDGRLVVTGAANGTAIVCDATTGKILHTLRGDPEKISAAHTDKISSAAFSFNDKQVVTASDDGTAKIWDTATGDLKFTLKHDAGVFAAAFSTDSTVVTVDEHRTIKTWDGAKGTLLFNWSEPIHTVVGVAVSPNGRWMLTTDDDGTTKVLDTAAQGTVLHTWKILKGLAWSASFTPDSEWVVTTDWNTTATIWRPTTGKIQAVLGPVQRWPPMTAAISPDGTLVVTAGLKTRVWEGMTGNPLITLSGNLARSVAFSVDGTRLVTAGDDGARIWEMKLENRPPADIARLIQCRVPWVLNGEGLMPVPPDHIDVDCILHRDEVRDKKD